MAGMLKKAAGIASGGKASNPHSSGMKGLKHFINEIRACPSKEAQKARVIKELGKFQFVFQNAKQMGSYQRKKYVCKLLYIFMLGYPLSANLYRESLRICSANKFSEKQVGYLAAGVFIHEKHELMPMLVTAIRRDLTNPSFEIQGLAVACIANIGGRELATQFSEEVTNILMSNQSSITLKKKASLCLLRIFRKYPDIVTPEFLMLKIHNLMALDHLGLLNSVMSLLQEIVVMSEQKAEFQVFVPRVLDVLDQMTGGVTSQQQSYEYCGVAHPWLQVHLLRFLARLDLPENPELAEKMVRIVTVALTKPIDPAGNNNRLLVSAAVRQEAALLASRTADGACHAAAGDALVGLLRAESPTVRATTLQVLARLMLHLPPASAAAASRHYCEVRDLMLQSAVREERHLMAACVDILCAMMASASDKTNDILQVLMQEAPRCPLDSRRVIADRVARFAASQLQSNPSWYAEVVVRLLAAAGDAVADAAWQQLVQVASAEPQLQAFSARLLLAFGREQERPADAFMIPAAVLVGRFGQQLAQEAGCSPGEQVAFFSRNLAGRSPKAHECVVTALQVLAGLYPALAGQVQQALNNPDNVPAAAAAAAAPPPIDRRLRPVSQAPQQPQQPPQPQQPQQPQAPALEAQVPPGTVAMPSVPTSMPAAVATAPAASEAPSGGAYGSGGGAAQAATYSPLGDAPPVPTRPPSQVVAQQSAAPEMAASPHASSSSPHGSGSSSLGSGPAAVYSDHVKQMWTAGQGVLYQSEHLQVGVILDKAATPLEVSLFLGNLTEAPLTDLRVQAEAQALPAVDVQAEAAPPQLDAGQQHQMVLRAACVAPYAGGVPRLALSYVAGGVPVSAVVELPVLVADFISPLPLEAGPFLAAWNHPEGNFEAVQQWQSSNGVSAMRLRAALASLSLAVVEGVEQQAENAVAACSVTAADLQYPVILRVEADAQFGMYRATAKSASQPLAFAVALLVKEFVS